MCYFGHVEIPQDPGTKSETPSHPQVFYVKALDPMCSTFKFSSLTHSTFEPWALLVFNA